MKSALVLDPKRRGTEAERLNKRLGQLVVGQEEAIAEIVDVYQLYLTGMNAPGRPIGNFLFLGPTGCGKTRLVEATAECLLNNPKAVIKIDCAEFQHGHEIAKLIGSPPGYLGHRETHALLSQEAIDRFHTERMKISFVLFDEIEKASDTLWNLLLGILDKGVLTLGDNRTVDFSRAMVFMTGNIGASEISDLLRPRLGFGASIRPQDGVVSAETSGRMDRSAKEAARRKFTPEFVNRLDKIVVFKPLGTKELRQIVELELGQVQQRIWNQSADRSFEFIVTEAGKDFLLEEGTDVRYGARHLKRAIDRLLVQPLASLIASKQVRGGDVLSIDHEAGAEGMKFLRTGERVVLAEAA
ncbi:MAG: AAA family ATPase [Bryobacteraceae bacterium]|jgi:ATP-dependent Clp protease ATP-binding subunit ClpA